MANQRERMTTHNVVMKGPRPELLLAEEIYVGILKSAANFVTFIFSQRKSEIQKAVVSINNNCKKIKALYIQSFAKEFQVLYCSDLKISDSLAVRLKIRRQLIGNLFFSKE